MAVVPLINSLGFLNLIKLCFNFMRRVWSTSTIKVPLDQLGKEMLILIYSTRIYLRFRVSTGGKIAL